MADIREYADSLLAQSDAIDMDAVNGTETVLFTVPAGKKCHITKVIMHSVGTATLGTVDLSFGFDTGEADDVITPTGAITLTLDDYFKIISPISNAKIGAAADTFKVCIHAKEGAAGTAKFDVFGYLY